MSQIKTYILDTSVLLTDPESLFAYPGADVVIPLKALEELDHFKKDYDERGRNSRAVPQLLEKLAQGSSMTKGVSLEGGGRLSIYILKDRNLTQSKGRTMLHVVQEIFQNLPGPSSFVTNDLNLRVRAAALGLKTQSYESRFKGGEVLYETIPTQEISLERFARLLEQGHIKVREEGYYANQAVRLVQGSEFVCCRKDQEKEQWVRVESFPKGVWGVKARNLEQEVALDLLMNDQIHLVTLVGKAGTGKTLLALAVAMELMLGRNLYEKILVSRPIFPMGRDMGFLPGDVEEKMEPWMQPIFDNLDFLSRNPASPGRGLASYKKLQEKELIELEPLTYIRGRSIPNRIMIVDEAQNLTPHEIKTIVTRAGEGTKLILTGDPHQIDHPYLDSGSNGLSYVIEKFRKYPLAGHINLMGGVRSPLAELASNIL